ncbi:MAG: glycine cleavage system aminomethyltransferase GcvT [Kiritimatiellaeota bacterium]|nr:glycine cleavage system aminomethyltransferase GcvT [Kiritimatiellota bacterium]
MNEGTIKVKETPLASKHIELGARMVPFAGWSMPVQYAEGIIAEHIHARTKVSLFDICHMGEFRITGAEAAAALDKIFPRAVATQKVGSCRYNFLLTDNGTVIDDLIIYRITEEEFHIVVNAGPKDADLARLRELLPPSAEIVDESDDTAKLDLQGPLSADVLEKMGLSRPELPAYYKWSKVELAGIPILLSRTGYTGELGFEIYLPAKLAGEMWDAILAIETVKPAGLGARDTLRLEMGYPLYGHEMDLKTTPIEAGFGGMLKLDSGREFVGREALVNTTRKKQLIGIRLEGRRTARAGAEVSVDGEQIGSVTSGAFSPSLQQSIALAHVTPAFNPKEGVLVDLAARRGTIPGEVAKTPFHKNGTVRMEI